MRYWVFWHPWSRRRVVRFANWSRCPRRLCDWLTDQLYPDDAVVTFLPKED